MTWDCNECFSQKQLCEDCATKKWNEYTNTWNKKPNMPDGWNKKPATPEKLERLDVSKMNITEVNLITNGKTVWTTHDIIKVYL